MRIIIALCISLLATPAWAQQDYVSQTMGFSLKIPKGWELQSDFGQAMSLIASERHAPEGLTRTSIIIALLPKEKWGGRDAIVEAALKRMEPHPIAIAQGEDVINEQHALWQRWEEDSHMTTHERDVILMYYFEPKPEYVISVSIRGDKEYFNENKEQVLGILRSITFVE